jgi:CHAT domain-containing protein
VEALTRHRTQAETSHAKVGRRSPLYQTLGEAGLVELNDVRSVLQADEALVAYAYEEHDGLWALVISRAKSAFVQLIPRLDSRLEGLLPAIKEVEEALRSKDLNYPFKSAQILHDSLIRPLETNLQGIQRLTILPDRKLALVPFPALVRAGDNAGGNGVSWLIRDYEVDLRRSRWAGVSVLLRRR